MIITNETTISELLAAKIISVRTFNVLNCTEIDTIQKISIFLATGHEIRDLKGLGRKAEYEIQKIKSFITSIDLYSCTEEVNFYNTSKELKDIFTNTLVSFLDSDKCHSNYFCSMYRDKAWFLFNNLKELNNQIKIIPELSKNENFLFRQTLINFIELLVHNMESQHINYIYRKQFQTKIDSFNNFKNFTLEEEVEFMSDVCKDFIQETFKELYAKHLSVRGINFVNSKIHSFTQLIPLFDQPISSYKALCPGQYMKKILLDIYQFNILFKQYFLKIYQFSDEEIHDLQLKKKYSFLLGRQRQFVDFFIKEYGYEPLYMLLYNYLRISENKSDKLYSLYYGIFDNKSRTFDELAELFHISRERVRQIIINNKPSARDYFVKDDSVLKPYEKLLHKDIITEDDSEYQKISETEGGNFSFRIFAFLTSILSSYVVQEVKGVVVLLSNQLVDKIKIRDNIEQLESILFARYSSDTIVSIDSALIGVPTEYKKEIHNLLLYWVKKIYHQEVFDNDKIKINQNFVDPESEIYTILEEKGEPMYLQEIYEAFNLKYPDNKVSNPEKIRYFIFKTDKIKAIGKQSLYGLDSWADVFFGSIRDLLIESLSENQQPMQLHVLFERVKKHFPNTNIKSVYSTMTSDELDRFVMFKDDFFGLKSINYSDEFIIQPTVQRLDFEKRIQLFKDFVDTYHRFPLASGGETEASLQRWYYNIINGVLEMTDNQKKIFDEYINSYEHFGYPRTGLETDFLNNCHKYKDYVNEYHRLPSSTSGNDLYAWFYRSKLKYIGFIDQRHEYMIDLLKYITSLGFEI